jgi:hypothetical protein
MNRECSLRKRVSDCDYVLFVQITEEAPQAFRVAVEGPHPPNEPFDPDLNMSLAYSYKTVTEAREVAWQYIWYLERNGWIADMTYSTF